MTGYGAVILAGHNQGRTNLIREYMEKKTYSLLFSMFTDSFIFGQNKALLPLSEDRTTYRRINFFKQMLSIYRDLRTIQNGECLGEQDMLQELGDGKERVISRVAAAVSTARKVDSRSIVCVGPKIPLDRLLSGSAYAVEQGSSLGENAALGVRALYEDLGYKGDHFLVSCGDLSAISNNTIDAFVESVEKRLDPRTDIYAGAGTWQSLHELMERYELAKYGKMGLRFFPFIPGRVNKWSLRVIDDAGVVSPEVKSHNFLWGNMFMANKNVAKRSDIAQYMYDHKRNLLDPRFLYRLIQTAGVGSIARLVMGNTVTVKQAEAIVSETFRRRFPDMPDFGTKLAYVPPEGILDIDTWKDHLRNSELIRKRDLEFLKDTA